jgi:hypothetical protein
MSCLRFFVALLLNVINKEVKPITCASLSDRSRQSCGFFECVHAPCRFPPLIPGDASLLFVKRTTKPTRSRPGRVDFFFLIVNPIHCVDALILLLYCRKKARKTHFYLNAHCKVGWAIRNNITFWQRKFQNRSERWLEFTFLALRSFNIELL